MSDPQDVLASRAQFEAEADRVVSACGVARDARTREKLCNAIAALLASREVESADTAPVSGSRRHDFQIQSNAAGYLWQCSRCGAVRPYPSPVDSETCKGVDPANDTATANTSSAEAKSE